MPLQATSGAASYDAFGGGVAVVPAYIEEVFSSYLYEGNGTTQQIVNGIDLSTKGGLVWTKSRSNAFSHMLIDTVRTSRYLLNSNTTGAQADQGSTIANFNTDGYTFTASGNSWNTNNYTNNLYVGWTFRKQPKFFDIVTYTGTGVAGRTVAHSLGSTPACMIVKQTSAAGQSWAVYHRELGATKVIWLDLTNAAQTRSFTWDDTAPTSTVFTVGAGGETNSNGQTYVAYLFAHDAGGFGLTGTDNVISCGSFTTDSSGNATVNLGYEPQYILMKKTSGVQNWVCYDIMRGWAQAQQAQLYPNITQAEDVYTGSPYFFPTATGFSLSGTFGLGNNATYIYIAIRRGPMKVPTTGTSVYKSSLLAGNSSTQQITDLDFPPDLVMTKARNTTYGNRWTDRLRGFGYALRSDDVGAQLDNTTIGVNPFNMNGFTLLGGNPYNSSGNNYVNHAFRRAPSFFDEVCYTGTVSATTFNHNLGVAPELMIVKCRSTALDGWMVYSASLPASSKMMLNQNYGELTGETTTWNSTRPTASVFSVGTEANVNGSTSRTYVNYLFATCAGVSKVGSYTGNGTTQTINCGFGAGGARFVLIKRTDSTGDWYVYDTARGMTTLTDPYLLFNTTDAEVATLGSVTTVSTGFALNSTILAAINVNAGTYIFLAIA